MHNHLEVLQIYYNTISTITQNTEINKLQFGT